MRARPTLRTLAAAAAAYTGAALAAAALPQADGLGPGPAWRGPVRPTASNAVFATGDGCAMCHSAAPGAVAMRSPTGDDLSPHALWQATAMANAFRDPFWRAQMAMEVAREPEHGGAIESSCLRCHAPMAHHSVTLAGLPEPTLADVLDDPLAHDGVSCTVCHQVQPDGLGTEASFSGRVAIGTERAIFGPHADPATGPMRMHSGYTPTKADHVSRSALCGACHTLLTDHGGGRTFAEQSPYLEWRNSAFEDEVAPSEGSRSCQDCHMPAIGATKIARNPGGVDFNIPVREEFSAHLFVGGNAFLLDLLRENAEELGVTAPARALERLALATRRQLAEDTTRVEVLGTERADGRLRFAVAVLNLTGHKFPTGYPARRAWLEVQVRVGREVVFHSGASDAAGRLVGVDDPQRLPHRATITDPSQVQVWELVAADSGGAPTTSLRAMATRLKDNRLLPRGWRADGPHADLTAPVGTGGDADFGPGGDRVAFDVPLASTERVTVVAWVRYQTMPPAWVDPLRAVDDEAARRFVRMHDAAGARPETAGLAVAIVE